MKGALVFRNRNEALESYTRAEFFKLTGVNVTDEEPQARAVGAYMGGPWTRFRVYEVRHRMGTVAVR